MGVLEVLIHAEKLGVAEMWRDGDKVAYCVKGSDHKKLSRLCRRIDRFLLPHHKVLLRVLRRGPSVATFDMVI